MTATTPYTKKRTVPFAGISASAVGTPLARYADLFARAHPGSSAPLGSAVSQTSMDDLTNQLREDANINELGKIRRWFSPTLKLRRGGTMANAAFEKQAAPRPGRHRGWQAALAEYEAHKARPGRESEARPAASWVTL
jgi:hypothetical protein